MKRLLTTCAPFCLLLPQIAFSQDIIELDEIVVSATLEPQPINRTGATVEVLGETDIADAPLSVAGAIDRVVGTSVSANGGLGANTTLRVRGLDGKYIGVRIDGIDVTDPSSVQTQFNFGGLTGAGLGRIEIVKGSQSALYGSEAVAGVVDIQTFALDEDGSATRLGFEAGSFGTVSASAGYAIRDGGTALSFNLSQVESDGFSRRSTDDEADGFSQTLLTLKGETVVGDGITIGGSALYRDSEAEIDRSATDPSGDNFALQRGARVFTAFDAFGIEHELSFSMFDTERQDPGGFTTEFNGDRTQIAYIGTTETQFGTLSFGLDETNEEFLTPGESGESTTRSAMVELLTQPSDTTDLALSLRYDDDDSFGSAVTGRVALAWQARPDLTVRAVAGNGFRAPSLYERFGPFGDPTLEVETSRSLELGVEQTWSTGSLQATLFYTEIEDLIGFGATTYIQTPGTTKSRGIELSGERRVSDSVTVSGGYTLTDAKTEGDRLVRVPRHDLFVSVAADINDRLSASATAQHVWDVVPSSFAPADNKVGDYTLFGIGVSYDVSDTTEAYLRIENLFDEDYETAGGFNMPGRSVFAGVRAQF